MTQEKVTLKDVYQAITELREEMASTYVTKDAFNPVQYIAYGLMALVGSSVVGAIIMLVVRGH